MSSITENPLSEQRGRDLFPGDIWLQLAIVRVLHIWGVFGRTTYGKSVYELTSAERLAVFDLNAGSEAALRVKMGRRFVHIYQVNESENLQSRTDRAVYLAVEGLR